MSSRIYNFKKVISNCGKAISHSKLWKDFKSASEEKLKEYIMESTFKLDYKLILDHIVDMNEKEYSISECELRGWSCTSN